MTILYLFITGLPLTMLILKIKNKEFEDPILFVIFIIWIIACTGLWFYMDWFSLESVKGIFDPDFIWKN